MKKYIKIELIETDKDVQTITNIKGLKPYEIVGLLELARDEIKEKIKQNEK